MIYPFLQVTANFTDYYYISKGIKCLSYKIIIKKIKLFKVVDQGKITSSVLKFIYRAIFLSSNYLKNAAHRNGQNLDLK